MNIIVRFDDLYKDKKFIFQNNIHFLETKINNIMVGDFTKLIYTNENMTLNGLYIHIELHLNNTIKKLHDAPKQVVYFNNNSHNKTIIHNLIQIENQLLNLYNLYKNCNKRPKYILQQQLLSEFIQLYSESASNNNCIVLKISGIWETDIAYGITYKFIEM